MFKIYNEDCLLTMDKISKAGGKVDVILTSPPYNTGRNCTNIERGMGNHERRYDIYLEERNQDEYTDWTVDIFNHYDSILRENGCILYNMSYGNENPEQMYLTIAEVINRTNFTIADTIIWKKKSALPNNVSHNKLTRICEFVFVFCRKDEYKTFLANKKVKSQSKTGQNYYENIYNFIEAKNNDGANKLNKATYSSELCEQLLNIYAKPNAIVYDNFNGTGTTGVACIKLGLNYIGSELSEEQCKFSIERLNKAAEEIEIKIDNVG